MARRHSSERLLFEREVSSKIHLRGLDRLVPEARHDARRYLQHYAVKSRADILPASWIVDKGIDLVEVPLDGASAQLVRVGKHAEIQLPEGQKDEGVRRFSMMHELYHLLKKHPSPSATMVCTPKWMRREETRRGLPEVGADAFAGFVLLPEHLLQRRCEVSPVSVDVPFEIAKEYEVSILTSAIRFTELTSERCAAVFSRKGVIEWAARSPTFTRVIEKGARISRESIAWNYFARGRLDERPQLVPARAWINTSADGEIVEHSIFSSEHRTVLSLLWVPESVAGRVRMATR